jgi:hypothetical protein
MPTPATGAKSPRRSSECSPKPRGFKCYHPMSKGPGIIERRIADLFAATRDSALSIEQIAAYAYELPYRGVPTRTQRLSATRATHRLLRRVRAAYAKHREIVNWVHDNARPKWA